MKRLMPNFLMFSRLPIMLMPYLVLYRLSKWLRLAQGKLSQPKQYLTSAFTIFSQFLIRYTTQDFDLRRSSPRQPGHGFLSLVIARQRPQFIPQEAISFAEIADVFVDLLDVMPGSLPRHPHAVVAQEGATVFEAESFNELPHPPNALFRRDAIGGSHPGLHTARMEY
jgi:hypothetical protein